MYIIGLNAYHADSSAALLKDGKLIAAIEEERFTRVKHWAGFPAQAIRFCLQEAGINIEDVQYISIGRDPKAKLLKKIGFVLRHPAVGAKAIRTRLENTRKVSSLENEFIRLFPESNKQDLKSRIIQVEHHRAHLASAFFASPFEDAALLSIDGSGDFTTTMMGTGHSSQMEILDSIDFPHSIGIFYSAFTQFLGFPHYGDEYKVMGLAPYGKPMYVDLVKEILKLTADGKFYLNLKYFTVTRGNIIDYGEDHIPHIEQLFSEELTKLFGAPRNQNEELTQHHKDIAASVQHHTEQTIFHLLRSLHEKTKLQNVCIAGGVAQNSVANGKVIRNTPFQKLYIPSAGHDAGLSIGSALYVHNQILRSERPAPVWNAYLGSKFDTNEIKQILDEESLTYRQYGEQQLYDVVTDKLIQGGVVGWFNGRSEFGPRALGDRSLLVDPRRNDAKELLNSKIKRRENFRPFAPSILQEHVKDFFEWEDNVPFMEKVLPIRKDKRTVIPAVTHVDGSGRLQSVKEEWNPKYYRLIKSFYSKTGVPVLLNTSFNENEPIVNHPIEAINCFKRTNMDMLVLENYVIERNGSGK